MELLQLRGPQQETGVLSAACCDRLQQHYSSLASCCSPSAAHHRGFMKRGAAAQGPPEGVSTPFPPGPSQSLPVPPGPFQSLPVPSSPSRSLLVHPSLSRSFPVSPSPSRCPGGLQPSRSGPSPSPGVPRSSDAAQVMLISSVSASCRRPSACFLLLLLERMKSDVFRNTEAEHANVGGKRRNDATEAFNGGEEESEWTEVKTERHG
ncbi:hypothetical protein EYF80_056175 [Liparis tanakae]|uniref:Uncharacterized protein n=1 Tax=Liparis tanakae TaxID=230148 RepID=A0A4Z2EZ62_9TELE|nr:hypothetical protein EYF80_056175 [Liparis tanakae]